MPIKLQIRRGTASQWTSANPTLLAGEIGYETDTGNFKVGDNSTAWTSLAYQFPYATGTKALDTTTLVVDQTNDRIGIGTAAPTAKLHVNGGITFGGTSTASTMSMDGGNNVVHNAWNGHFFQTGGTTRARVESAGNFSVGPAVSAYGKIEANSAAAAVGIGLKTDLTSPDSANLYFKTDGTGYRMNVGSYSTATSSFTSAMTVTDGQRVGIGTNAPSTTLQVNGTCTATTFAGSGASLTANTIPYGALANLTAAGFLGRNSAGVVSEVSVAAAQSMLGIGSMAAETSTDYARVDGTSQIGSLCLVEVSHAGGSVTRQTIAGAFTSTGPSNYYLRPASGTWTVLISWGMGAASQRLFTGITNASTQINIATGGAPTTGSGWVIAIRTA